MAQASPWFRLQILRLRTRLAKGPDSDETVEAFGERLLLELAAILKRDAWNVSLIAGILANATDDRKGYRKPNGRPPALGKLKRSKSGRPASSPRVRDRAWLDDLLRRRAEYRRAQATDGDPFLRRETLSWDAAECQRLRVPHLSPKHKQRLYRLLKRHDIRTSRTSRR